METNPIESNGAPKKQSLKKQLSFDEKVTEIRLTPSDAENNSSRKKSIQWWAPSGNKTFGAYCEATSVHGLQYLGAEGIHLCERILWTIVFALSVLSAVWLIRAVLNKYNDSPLIVTFEPSETFIGDLPFPAVTLCNMNRVLKSKATKYMELANRTNDDDTEVQVARQNVYYLDHVCSVSNKPFSKMFNYSTKRGTVDQEILNKARVRKEDEGVVDVLKFLKDASQPCNHMIQLCMWEGDVIECKNNFIPIETNFGKCCVFNMVPRALLHRSSTNRTDRQDIASLLEKWRNPNPDALTNGRDKGKSTTTERLRRQNRAGKASGLMLLADPALDEYFCSSSDSTGFRMTVHPSTDIPHVTDFGLAIRPNYEHFISITPDVTRGDPDIRSYPIEKRNCYFEDEYPLKYYYVYSSSNCIDECVANLTYAECNCVRYYMPRDDTRDICRPANFSCAENVRLRLYKTGKKSVCQQCLPTCAENRYSASVTMAPLQRVDLWVNDETNTTAPWAKSNISIVHVYFGQESTYIKVRSQLYGITDLIANIGGLLGLCMGFSMLSLFELLYHLTARPWFRKIQPKVKSPKRLPATGTNESLPNGCVSNPLPLESRRVKMKPGDDGRYYLQSPSSTIQPCYATAVSNKHQHSTCDTEADEDSRL